MGVTSTRLRIEHDADVLFIDGVDSSGNVVAEACYHAVEPSAWRVAVKRMFGVKQLLVLPTAVLNALSPTGRLLVVHKFRLDPELQHTAGHFLDSAIAHVWCTKFKVVVALSDYIPQYLLNTLVVREQLWTATPDCGMFWHVRQNFKLPKPKLQLHATSTDGLHVKMVLQRNVDALSLGTAELFGKIVGLGFLTKLVIPTMNELRWPYVIFEAEGKRQTEYVPSRKLFTQLSQLLAHPDRGRKTVAITRNPDDWTAYFC